MTWPPARTLPMLDWTTDLRIGTHTLASRLIVGTGKYASYELMARSAGALGHRLHHRGRAPRAADRRAGRTSSTSSTPAATRCCPTRPAASRPKTPCASPGWAARFCWDWKTPAPIGSSSRCWATRRRCCPIPIATLAATEQLVAEGFQVLCYTSDDPIMARRLKEAGATSVMPAGSPIGSGQGILNPNNIRICLEYLKDGDPDYPVIVDAGVGTASDVTFAMELGVDGVLLNTGIAHAGDPLQMAQAMRAGHRSRAAWPFWPAGFPRSSTPRPAAPRSARSRKAAVEKRRSLSSICCMRQRARATHGLVG